MQTFQAILDFWFADQSRQQWFKAGPGFDEECADTGAHLLGPAAAGDLQPWLQSPRGRLAFIVLTDQLPRNIHRGTAQAYAWDSLALTASREGLAAGDDRGLNGAERTFFYMPFEHSENLLDQHLAVGLFSHLRDESPQELREQTGNQLRFAQQHRQIILRFGRFPHRNAVLQRSSTAEELEFVAAGDGFGQFAQRNPASRKKI